MSKPTRDRGPPASAITKLINSISGRHHTYQVFSDFVEMAAISVSNAVDLAQRDTREARYLEIVKRYEPGELGKFPHMLGELVNGLEDEPTDILGKVFHELELHNKWTGQFFTPFTVCHMMAKINVGDGFAQKVIEERGFIRAAEPACGSGAMVIALALALKDEGVNYQQQLHVTATDIDAKCVHMAYLQLSLLNIPAIIIHGNSLANEEFGRWYTPAHIMDGWNWKLRRALSETTEPHKIIAPEPLVPVPHEPSTQAIQLQLF